MRQDTWSQFNEACKVKESQRHHDVNPQGALKVKI